MHKTSVYIDILGIMYPEVGNDIIQKLYICMWRYRPVFGQTIQSLIIKKY